jgi:hypothetical protein
MRVLRAVLVVHGVITLAGAVVLTAFPTAIPAMVGITVQRQDYLLVYLLAAAELAVSALSLGAARLTNRAALQLVIITLVTMHLASGLLNILYMGLTGVTSALIINTVMRFVVVAVLIAVWLRASHQMPGTNR